MAERVAKETIDERVLRLLGLEDEVEISYEEYIRALKEALSTIQLGKGGYSTEEAMLLQDEFKKVKAKKGKFKPKSKKITADNIATTRFLRPSAKPLLAPAKKPITAEGLSGEGIAKDVEDISAKLDELLKELRDGYRLEKEEAEKNRKEREDKKRKDRERLLKKGQIQAIRAAKKFLSPVQSILDQIANFITYTLLGRAFKMFMDWSSDPKNKGKLESLGRFIKDWWPTLLGLWFFFVNPLGKFIRTIVGSVLRLTFKLAKFAIPRLVAFIAENPAAGLAGLAVASGIGAYASEQNVANKRKQINPKAVTPQDTAKTRKGPGSAQLMQESVLRGGAQAFSRGGFLNTFGNTYQGFTSGTDPAVAGNIYQGYTYGLGSGFPGYYTGGTLGWYEGYKRGGVFSGNVDETTGQYVKGAGPDTQFLPMQGGGGVVLQKGESVLQVGARERMMQQTGIDPLAFNIGANANKPRTIGNNIFGRAFGGLLGYAGGGAIGTAADIIKKDEALSSLSPGKNDYIKPGGKSVMSNIDWSKLTPTTPIHAYSTGVSGDRPTIGWGATFYDDILNGTKPVKPGDVITKAQADGILNNNIADLSSTYSKKIPNWNTLNQNQQAGILSIGYNAPAGPIGAYPKLTAAIKSGDMKSAAQNAVRSGPNPERIKTEQRLLLDTSKPNPVIPTPSLKQKEQPNIFQNLGAFANNLLGIKPAIDKTSKVNTQTIKKQGGGIIKENTGIDVPGATADRQQIFAQPGEYILPKKVVETLGVNILDKLVANIDNNSTPAKLGRRNLKITMPEPPAKRSARGGMMTLPPIKQSAGGSMPGVNQSVGTVVPSFSVVASAAQEIRMQNAERYGIVA